MIDEIDRKIMKILQNNARTANAQLARELHLAPSGIHQRIKKLEQRGIIKGYHANLDVEKLGCRVTAFLMIKTEDRVGSIKPDQRRNGDGEGNM